MIYRLETGVETKSRPYATWLATLLIGAAVPVFGALIVNLNTAPDPGRTTGQVQGVFDDSEEDQRGDNNRTDAASTDPKDKPASQQASSGSAAPSAAPAQTGRAANSATAVTSPSAAGAQPAPVPTVSRTGHGGGRGSGGTVSGQTAPSADTTSTTTSSPESCGCSDDEGTVSAEAGDLVEAELDLENLLDSQVDVSLEGLTGEQPLTPGL